MKNSPRHNPTKDVTAPITQKQQWSANRAETYTHLQFKPHSSAALPHGELPAKTKNPGIRASTPMVVKPDKSVPLRAAQGNDHITSQEKTA